MSDIIREWGLKLILTKIKLVGGPEEFFRQVQIKKWNLAENTSSGLKIYKDVLWMRLLEESEGMRLPNGCRFFAYIPFWKEVFPRGKKYYRFKDVRVFEQIRDESDLMFKNSDISKRPWEYHAY